MKPMPFPVLQTARKLLATIATILTAHSAIATEAVWPTPGYVTPPLREAGAEQIPPPPGEPPPTPNAELIPSPVVGGAWVSLGPAATLNGQVTIPPNNEIGGALQALAVHPTNASILYVGAVNGGIWRTTNATAASPSWTSLTNSLSSLSIASLEFDRSDATAQTLVAGSGRLSSFGAVGGARIGVLRTTDGGANWTVLGTSLFENENLTSVAGRGAVIMAASDDTWGGGNGSGLFRSTNTGASFVLVSGTNGLPAGAVSDLVGDPANVARFFAAVRGVGIFRSDNSGATWVNVTNNLTGITSATNKVEMAMCNNGTTNAIFVGVLNADELDGVWRSTNLGTTWTRMDTPSTGGQGDVHFAIAADRTNTSLVYVAGQSANPNSRFRGDASLPLGSQFTSLQSPNSAGTTPHADSREMFVDAGGTLIDCSDGGIYRRPTPQNNTTAWNSANGNLAVFEAHDIAYDSVANIAMIGTQDNGTHIQSASGSTVWTFISGGDGGDVAIDDTSTPNQSIRYGSSQYLGGFYRRTYNASNVLVSTINPPLNLSGGSPAISTQFNTPIALNRVNAARLIIGGDNAAYESLDRGDTVTALTPNSGVNGTFTGNPIAYGGYIAGVPNADVLYYGSGTTVRVRTTASGAIAATASPFPGGDVQDIVLDRNDWRRVYVAGSSAVYFSPNSGATWTNITGDLVGVGSLHTLEFFQLGANDCVAVGTDTGVYCSFVNNLGTWSRLGSGLPSVLVYDMTYSAADNLLVIGTMGRGAFRLPIELDPLVVTPPAGLASAGLSGGPFTPSAQNFTLTNSGTTALNWTAANTQAWVRLSATSGTLAAGASTTVTVSLRRGAAALPPGTFTDPVVFRNATTGANQSRPVNLTVSDALSVSPETGLNGSGLVAGPFAPASQVYALTNGSTAPITWTASKTQTWLNLSATSGTISAGGSASLTVSFNATANGLAAGTYTDTVIITNTVDGVTQTRPVSLAVKVPAPDYFTEIFDSTSNDTSNQSWLFTPNASTSFYRVVRSLATAFPTDPAGGTSLILSDDSYSQVTPTGAAQVRLYGVAYSTFYVGSNGYITFVNGNTTFSSTLSNHFALPRIAPLFIDLNPSSGGTVSWKQLSDRVAVTFQNVQEYAKTTTNSFQVEMYFDGRIRITCLGISATGGIIGLSRGLGVPADFAESDFSTYPLSLLGVSPAGGLTSSGLRGGPFTPSSQIFTLTNSGTTSLNWSAAKTQSWLTLSTSGGTIAPGASTTVIATLNAAAQSLSLGAFSDTITITDTINSVITTRPVSLTVVDPLGISPATGLSSSGLSGGPFTPSSQVYTLTNNGSGPLNWIATKTQPWVSISSSGGTLAAGGSTAFVVSINAAAAPAAVGGYSDTVTLRNTTSGVSQTRPVNLNVNSPIPDYLTEIFDTTTNDTANQSWLFTPNGSNNFYRVARTPVTSFPTDPAGGTVLPLTLDSFLQVTPPGAQVSLYGVSYPSFFVSSKAYITMTAGDFTYEESLTSHFSLPRIAALFDDLDPASGGTVSWKQFSDRVAVTWLAVPEFGTTNSNSVQIEMFFDGRIRITCLALAATDGLIGLSRGAGVPSDFVESDFNTYAALILKLETPASLTEGDAPTTGTVSLSSALENDLTVSLASSAPERLTVPATVTIPAGSTSATFEITVIDDSTFDGALGVLVTAAADEYYNAPAVVAVNDNEISTEEHRPYEQWLTTRGLSGPAAEPDEDFDRDGTENLVEWAFGTNPKSANTESLIVSAGAVLSRGNPITITMPDGLGHEVRTAAFARRKDALQSGLVYTVEFSTDLATWTASAERSTVIADADEIEVVTVPYPPATDGSPATFFRISITLFEEEEEE